MFSYTFFFFLGILSHAIIFTFHTLLFHVYISSTHLFSFYTYMCISNVRFHNICVQKKAINLLHSESSLVAQGNRQLFGRTVYIVYAVHSDKKYILCDI